MLNTQGNTPYEMHCAIEEAYSRVHDWFDEDPEMRGYHECNYNDHAQVALERENPCMAAFNFHLYFPTHFFKARHALEADDILGNQKLVTWLKYNPYITFLDMGCGDGAASVAFAETILRLREEGWLDPRSANLHCIGVDPNRQGLAIYETMMEAVAGAISKYDINLTFDICPQRVSEASMPIESLLRRSRLSWQQPSLRYLIAMESNLDDLLAYERKLAQRMSTELGRRAKLRTFIDQPIPFGAQLASFYYQLFEMTPIDHLHILTVDTNPNQIRSVVEERLSVITERISDRGHVLDSPEIALRQIDITNPARSYWRRAGHQRRRIGEFLVSTCASHNRDLQLDDTWQRITSIENLELAWARVRHEMQREAFSDEIEIRLFERNLEHNLERLHFELDAYAIRLGYISDTLAYAIPKAPDQSRPKGLTSLEEEIMMVAIVQVIGLTILRNEPSSYAYRMSNENSPERGATEYLYERWSEAWKAFRQDVGDYARRHPDAVALKTDIKSYFTRILHDRLHELVHAELNVTSKRIEWLIRALVSKRLPGHDIGKGLVQGSVGSGFLANVYLRPLDRLFPVNDSRGRRLYRYVDDIYVIIPDPADEKITTEQVFRIIDELELDINLHKTRSYPVQQFLATMVPYEDLDILRDRYKNLVAPLRWLDGDLRSEFAASSTSQMSWWGNVRRYRDCLIELGFYLTESQLSRWLQQAISASEIPTPELAIPTLPFGGSVAENREWAADFWRANPDWKSDFVRLKHDLSVLFTETFAFLNTDNEEIDDDRVTSSGRRLRFAANRLGLLGFDRVHAALTNLLCDKPWLVGNQRRLLEDLARQGYQDDVWKILEHHLNGSDEMATYISAICLRTVRFLPRLELGDWQRLTELMVDGSEITRLMATETWLNITAKMTETPLSSEVDARVQSLLVADNLPPRRLLKNYLLVLGTTDPSKTAAVKIDHQADPLISEAFEVASQGAVASLLLADEPDVLRLKYYSSKYQDFNDGGEPSPG